MRKQLLTITTLIIYCLTACRSKTDTCGTKTDSFSVFIPVDTANKMLASYLTSINYSQNDTDLQSLTVDAGQLRSYLNAGTASDPITSIKLMFAHTLAFANSSRSGANAGYKNNALTIIIAAVKANGDYVYYTGNTVLDYTAPCPTHCPSGQAASPYLTTVTPKR